VPNKKKLVVRKGKKVFAKVVNDAAPLPVEES
jgi:archaeosine-15-forming tRNA-guanine transglycosylase